MTRKGRMSFRIMSFIHETLYGLLRDPDKALRAAIDNYYERNGMIGKVKKEAARVVCKCMNVTDKEIEEAALEGARTLYELQERTKLGTVCGQCKEEATRLLNEYVRKHFNK